MKYITVIGLEVHAELSTKTKIYCSCKNSFGSEVNSNCCPNCTGMPGSLPTLNEKVVEYAIRMGYATGCTINPVCKADRKNYFYPDLPKAYQISQFDIPLCEHGYIDAVVDEEGNTKRIGITRIHIEEDAGKLIHSESFSGSLVDLNRCGVPLIEIVSEPDMRSAHEAKAYLDSIRAILQYLDISDCKMQEGSIRCDVNVSVMPEGSAQFGTRCEMTNVNGFSAVERAIEYEARRQMEILEAGGTISQETRRWDDLAGKNYLLRSKEDAQDYRYFPEPDLPPVELTEAYLDELRQSRPELAEEKRARYQADYGLSDYNCRMITSDQALAALFEGLVALGAPPRQGANWIMGEVLGALSQRAMEPGDMVLTAPTLARLIALVEGGTLNRNTAVKVFEAVFDTDGDVDAYVKEHGLEQVNDSGLVREACAKVLSAHPKSAAAYQGGKEKAFGFLVGQVMRELKGRANPQAVNAALKELLGS